MMQELCPKNIANLCCILTGSDTDGNSIDRDSQIVGCTMLQTRVCSDLELHNTWTTIKNNSNDVQGGAMKILAGLWYCQHAQHIF